MQELCGLETDCHASLSPKGTCFAARSDVGNPFPARHRRADGTSGTPSPTERFAALMRRAGCPHPAARQTKAPAINGGGLRAGRPTRNPAAVRPLMRAGRGSEFHPARGIPKRKTTQRVVFLYFSRSAQQNRRGSNSLPGIPRMAEPFTGALPSPLDLTRFAQVEAASSTLPAAFQKERHP